MRFRTKILGYCNSWPFTACRFRDKWWAVLFKRQMNEFICGKIPISFWSALRAWAQFSPWGPQEVTLVMRVLGLKSLAPGVWATWPVLGEEQFLGSPLCRSPWASLGEEEAHSACCAAAAAAGLLCYASWQRLGNGRVLRGLRVKWGTVVMLLSLFWERMWYTSYTHSAPRRGFPDPSWPIKPALQLATAGVCEVALLLVRIWLQRVMLA